MAGAMSPLREPSTRPPRPTAADSAVDTAALIASWPSASGWTIGRWFGWRLRALVLASLAVCLLVFGLARWLAATPASPPIAASAAAAAAPRWLPDDSERAAFIVRQAERAAAAQAAGTAPRGIGGLGWGFWLLCAPALLLMLLACAVALARPLAGNLLYLAAGIGQGGNLLLQAAGTMAAEGWPAALAAWDLPLRATFDLATGAALVHAVVLYPRPLPSHRRIGRTAWALAAAVAVAIATGVLPAAWWWLQGVMLGFGLAALALIQRIQHPDTHPVARLMQRLLALALIGGAAVTVAVGWLPPAWARPAPYVWHLMGAALLVVPLLSRSRQAMREFALLAGISAVAASLDLLFIAVFSLEPFASLALIVFVALGLYAGARQWLLDRLLGSQMLTAERIFEQLYRAAREVQAHPERHAQVLGELLRQTFEPLEVRRSARRVLRARVAGGGSSLLVPVPELDNPSSERTPTLVLRFSRRGQRIFTREDAMLADRLVEQLRRAVAYDMAVERGRSEERLRIAQDLHDDIGARLLTLMYQAPNREMEDYVRHTLKDLKTLTRGLASSEHRLSHAVAEWKADLSQRLAAARIDLDWQVRVDEDLRLSMVQWSAITRVLRELVTNAIHHAQASRVRVELALNAQSLHLVVADNGQGGDPQAWKHGLGLGGVRKRVKQLGGEVAWRAGDDGGIVCEVRVAPFVARE